MLSKFSLNYLHHKLYKIRIELRAVYSFYSSVFFLIIISLVLVTELYSIVNFNRVICTVVGNKMFDLRCAARARTRVDVPDDGRKSAQPCGTVLMQLTPPPPTDHLQFEKLPETSVFGSIFLTWLAKELVHIRLSLG